MPRTTVVHRTRRTRHRNPPLIRLTDRLRRPLRVHHRLRPSPSRRRPALAADEPPALSLHRGSGSATTSTSARRRAYVLISTAGSVPPAAPSTGLAGDGANASPR